MNTFLFLLFLISILVLPFFTGLFFEEAQLKAQVPLLVLSLVSIGHYGLRSQGPDLPLKLLGLAVAFPVYLLLISFNGVSLHYSSVGNLNYLTYFAFFITGLLLFRSHQALIQLQGVILISGWAISAAGLVSGLGANFIEGNLLAGRLCAVFNYPNTYAAFLLALIGCAFLTYSASQTVLSKAAAALLPLLVISFLLARSRGALLLAPMLIGILYLHLPKSARRGTLLSFLLLLLPGLLAYPFFRQAFQQEAMVPGLFLLLLAAAATYYLGGIIQKPSHWHQTIAEKFYYFLFLILLAGGIVFFGFYKEVLSSLSGIAPIRSDQSIYERIIFNQDGFKIFQDYLLTGAGLGAWKVMYTRYQSFPYISSQPHNFYLQLLLETGIVGFSVFISFIGYIFYLFYKQRRSCTTSGPAPGLFFLVIVVTFLLHGLLDFDFSYGYINLLFFASLAALCSTSLTVGRFPGNALPLSYPKFRLNIFLVLMLLLLVSGLFINTRYVMGVIHYDRGLAQIRQKDYPAAWTSLQTALAYFPVHKGYKKTTASLQEAMARTTGNRQLLAASAGLYHEIIEAEPYDVNAYGSLLNYYLQEQQHQEILKLAPLAIGLAPFRPSHYEVLFQSAAALARSKQLSAAGRDLGLKYYRQLTQLAAGINRLPAGLYVSHRLLLSATAQQNIKVLKAYRH